MSAIKHVALMLVLCSCADRIALDGVCNDSMPVAASTNSDNNVCSNAYLGNNDETVRLAKIALNKYMGSSNILNHGAVKIVIEYCEIRRRANGPNEKINSKIYAIEDYGKWKFVYDVIEWGGNDSTFEIILQNNTTDNKRSILIGWRDNLGNGGGEIYSILQVGNDRSIVKMGTYLY